MSTAFIFPGQGSQAIGMGQSLAKRFASAKLVFEEVNEALSDNLSELMWNGSADELMLTRNAQPALMAVSLAAIAAMKEAGFPIKKMAAYVAGHSLGEYSALAAAGSLELADTARLLRIRGEAMQSAVAIGEGAMAAILGLELDQIEDIVSQSQDVGACEVANDNAPGQIVISGHKTAVEKGIDCAKRVGARRTVMLPVSAPFHCSLMLPAAEKMKLALNDVIIKKPVVPLIANVTALPVSEPETIKNYLVQQVTGRVRWRESIMWLSHHDVTELYEIGAGKVLSGLARRIAPSVNVCAVNTSDDIENI